MAYGEDIIPFSEYLRQLDAMQASGSDESVVAEEPQIDEGDTDTANETVYAEADEVVEDTGAEPDPSDEDEDDESDAVEEEEDDFYEPAYASADTGDEDLDSLFRRLLEVSVSSKSSEETASRSSTQAKPAKDRVAQLEEQVQQMQQMLQQSLQVVQQTAQLMNMQQETEAFRLVARSLQADGIFLSEQQLRDLWTVAYEKGLPPSLVIKAHAFDMIQQSRPSVRDYEGRPYQYPFLLGDREPVDTNTAPNEFRSFRDFLKESEYQRLRSNF